MTFIIDADELLGHTSASISPLCTMGVFVGLLLDLNVKGKAWPN